MGGFFKCISLGVILVGILIFIVTTPFLYAGMLLILGSAVVIFFLYLIGVVVEELWEGGRR